MINYSMIQENWQSVARKFPIICVTELNDIFDLKDRIPSYSMQFDHVFALMPSNVAIQEINEFCQKERIINLSIVNEDNFPKLTIEEKSQHVVRGQMIIFSVKKNKKIEKNIRWLIYDRVCEMKSPLTDVLLFDDDINYCLENESFVVKLRLDNQ